MCTDYSLKWKEIRSEIYKWLWIARSSKWSSRGHFNESNSMYWTMNAVFGCGQAYKEHSHCEIICLSQKRIVLRPFDSHLITHSITFAIWSNWQAIAIVAGRGTWLSVFVLNAVNNVYTMPAGATLHRQWPTDVAGISFYVESGSLNELQVSVFVHSPPLQIISNVPLKPHSLAVTTCSVRWQSNFQIQNQKLTAE